MSSPVKVGEILADKYKIERVLGVGGMGVVVAAKHLDLGERVAIKFLLPQALARQDVVQRFRQEARAAAKLKSDHVARVHDVGTLEGGAPFMVMEYLDGADIGAVLRERGPLEIEVAVDYVLQACEALAEAHAASIVHRDLKPGNLFLIKKNDGTPSIKIIDFGISKVGATGEGPAEGTGEMTQTAVMMGSPLYMAPEQMASARDVDARADIWSLGIILHCLLTGVPPFKASSVMQVYELIMLGAPPLRTLRAETPEGLENVVLRCLQKNRKARYENVAELAEALAPFGPAHAHASADRTKRILALVPKKESVRPPAASSTPPPAIAATPAPAPSIPDAPAPPRASGPGEAPAAKPAIDPLKSASLSTSPPLPELSPPAPPDPSATDGPWGQQTRPPTRNRRTLSLLVAGVVGAIAVAAVAFATLRNRSPSETTSIPESGALATSTSTSTSASALASATSTPSVLPGPAAPEAGTPSGSQPTASATAQPSPTLASTPTATAPGGVIAPQKPMPTYVPPVRAPTAAPTAKKPDLWGDRR